MRAFLLLVVVMGAVVADEAVNVAKPVVMDEKGQEVKAEGKTVEAKAEGKEVDLGSRTAVGDIGERSAVPAAPIYPYPYSTYYWPYVALAAPSQVARSDGEGVVPAAPYYYPYAYTYPYYTYPYAPVVAAAPAPAPAPPVGASVYYGNWQ
ncbi:vitelline membrane protein Vm26Ab-like [Schistocerca gregaria]|uniref:vitelline membrane protein Vm26Ab-like n=1 Tax=Schistocerca gregaria TaxID=7010 RepID=UPI00211DA82B|nr:vitelline membrane protein Vm26Ab-like [Schistocerca gregaria]